MGPTKDLSRDRGALRCPSDGRQWVIVLPRCRGLRLAIGAAMSRPSAGHSSSQKQRSVQPTTLRSLIDILEANRRMPGTAAGIFAGSKRHPRVRWGEVLKSREAAGG